MQLRRLQLAFIIFFTGVALAACTPATPPSTPTPSLAPTHTPSPTVTLTPTDTTTPTITAAPTMSPTPTPDYVWGTINVAQASCRFGPGGGYLLRTTLYQGEQVEILGHMLLNENWWFLHTLTRPEVNCWVSQELIDLGGDRSQILPISNPHLVLPFTTQPYPPLSNLSAQRSGNLVTVQWQPFEWLPGDDSLQDKYLLEVWICLNGRHVFRAYSTNAASIEFQDEQTCSEPSYGRAFGSDKHGYTRWVTIPWPQ